MVEKRSPDSLISLFNTHKILVPFVHDEAIELKEAADIAKRSISTVRKWCEEQFIGRRVAGGKWLVSRIALAAWLDGNEAALVAYLAGERHTPQVFAYLTKIGLDPALYDGHCITAINSGTGNRRGVA